MIVLLVGTSVAAGVALGWYGYKASVRIQTWGQRMNECDSIFQVATAGTERTNFDEAQTRVPKDGPRIVPLAAPPLRH
jgi:hypothetical protein